MAPGRGGRKLDLPVAADLPSEFQNEVILQYDVAAYPFANVIKPILQEPPECDLARLHESTLYQDIMKCISRRSGKPDTMGPRLNPWNKRFNGCRETAPTEHSAFQDVYHRFLREFVLDHLGTDRIAFQSQPAFRCHLPSCGAPGRPHRDEDYKHPRCEVNFWIPLTRVFGTNSLYAETRRDVGDFRAFELGPGELVRFYGNQVWHFTVPNETNDTRISIDFRVIREQEFSPAAFSFFRPGAYYDVMTRHGLLLKNSLEMQRLNEAFDRAIISQCPSAPLCGEQSVSSVMVPTASAARCVETLDVDDAKQTVDSAPLVSADDDRRKRERKSSRSPSQQARKVVVAS
eukprot:TRINITY_DN34539_c0_g1_i1.p1 TRINITY_DN34539_c0_g1~~TRINITY_DN34539_c0_g1_i1.p1  ORF type:complete len:346 (+),score=35.14 TRINITY_DN34539_c0_g1_i1:97-1134(+)